MSDITCLFALDTTELPKQALMVVGGAAVGALGLGLFAQLMTRWLTMKKLPTTPTNVARGAGGLALGVLTALWVWQGGGWGLGGAGGTGLPGNGPGTGETKPEEDKAPANVANETTDKDKTAPNEANPPAAESVLRLEVLTDEAARKLDGQQAIDQQRYYRIENTKDLKNLAGLRELIEKRREDKPPLQRLDVVTRPDSPDKTAPRTEQVRAVAHDFGLRVEFPPR